jgi:hypothetical protein
MNTLAGLEGRGNSFWSAIGLFLIAIVGLLDYLTGIELSFSLFYLIPISLVAWFAGKEFVTHRLFDRCHQPGFLL